MYDIDRQYIPSLSSFSNNDICYYISQGKFIKNVQKSVHYYQNQHHINQMLQKITFQLFKYSNSLLKISSLEEEKDVQDILLKNSKTIVTYNCDKYGLIPEQINFFLVLSYLHSYRIGIKNLREYLNEVHFLINVENQKQQPLPETLVMLLNGQYQELICYLKQNFSIEEYLMYIENIVKILLIKIEEKQMKNYGQNLLFRNKYEKVFKNVNLSTELKKLNDQFRKKGQSFYELFEGKYQLQIIQLILSGNQFVCEQVSKGSWGLYLNLYINFIQPSKPTNQPRKSYENVIKSYIQKYFQNSKSKKQLNQREQFLVKILNNQNKSNRFSFHQIYQSSFEIFSPVLCHLIGVFLIEFGMVDLYSMHNNKEYEEEIRMRLLESCSEINFSTLVNMIGYIKNIAQFKQQPIHQSVWQNLLMTHLPYQFSYYSSNTTDNNINYDLNPIERLQNQIKQIQQKICDLNVIGLNNLTKQYLNRFFKLQLKQENSNNKLNEQILELFFMNLQVDDMNNTNQCIHLMKKFMSYQYKTNLIDYRILDHLQTIFSKKRKTLTQKILKKIQKLFDLVYRIKEITQIDDNIETLEQKQQNFNMNDRKYRVLLQLQKINQLFILSSRKSKTAGNKKMSLCLELLKLGKQVYEKINLYFSDVYMQDYKFNGLQGSTSVLISQQNQQSQVLKQIKSFERNICRYIKEWKQQIYQPKKQNVSDQRNDFAKVQEYMKFFDMLIN